MFYPRPDYRPSAYDDDWEDIPTSGPTAKWFGGVIAPLALIGYGLRCILTRQGVLLGRDMSMKLQAHNGAALGVAILSMGTFLHFHYFWGNIIHLSAWAVLGKIVSLMAVIGGLGFLLWHVGVMGR